MKKFFLSVAIAFISFASITTINASTLNNTNDSNPIVLIKKGKPGNVNTKGLIPRITYSTVEAWFVDGFLCFDNGEDVNDVEVSIYDEEGENVSSSIIDILVDEYNMLDISFLPSGYYTLNVTINGVDYYGFFEY